MYIFPCNFSYFLKSFYFFFSCVVWECLSSRKHYIASQPEAGLPVGRVGKVLSIRTLFLFNISFVSHMSPARQTGHTLLYPLSR